MEAALGATRFDAYSHRDRLRLELASRRRSGAISRSCSLGFQGSLSRVTSLTGRGFKRQAKSAPSSIGGDGDGDHGSGGDGGSGSRYLGRFHGHEGSGGSTSRLSLCCCSLGDENQESTSFSLLPRIRSFYCVSVGPVLGDDGWQAFANEKGEDCESSWRSCLLPCYVQADIMHQLLLRDCRGDNNTLLWIKNEIESWYHGQGYTFAKVRGFTGTRTGLLCCKISEGTITEARFISKDARGDEIQGRTRKEVILGELPLAVKEGMPYNENAVKEAIQVLRQLRLFQTVGVEVKKNLLDGLSLRFLLQEKSQLSCYFQSGLSFFSSDSGRPIPASIRPTGTLFVEDCNIAGNNRALHGYINVNDLLRPQDDSRFKLAYIHPYLSNGLNKTLRVSCYNSRKLTAVYSHPMSEEQTPAFWVDRAGFKASIIERLTKKSKLSYGFVLEEVSTRDGLGPVQTPHTQDLSIPAGMEHVPFLRVKITRDNTRLVHGSRIGAIDIFQVDQGIGIFSLFNKHLLSTTRYLSLPSTCAHSFPVVIVRARYGGILGDAPSYQSFSYSSRGEMCSCSGFLELMSEARIPLPIQGQQHYAYSFVESVTALDRGSCGAIARSFGRGIVIGVGAKLGEIRTECVLDCGTLTPSLNIQMGDRV